MRWHLPISPCVSRYPRDARASPLQHQASCRLERLLVAVGFKNPNRCLRVAPLVRILHEGFNLVDGGEVGPGEDVLEFGSRVVGDEVFAQVKLVRYVIGVNEADDGLQPFLHEGGGALPDALIQLAKVFAREQAFFGA